MARRKSSTTSDGQRDDGERLDGAEGELEPPPSSAEGEPRDDAEPPRDAEAVAAAPPEGEGLAGEPPPLPPADAPPEEQRAYLVQVGLVSEEEAAELGDDELATLRATLGGEPPATRPGGPAIVAPLLPDEESDPEAAREAERVETQLRALGREDKIALVTRVGPLSVPEAANLGPDELDTMARAVLEQELARERASAGRRIEPTAAQPVGTPYGGDAPQHYRVERQHAYAADGQVIVLAEGSVINANTHDVQVLRGQGAELVEIDPPEPYIT